MVGINGVENNILCFGTKPIPNAKQGEIHTSASERIEPVKMPMLEAEGPQTHEVRGHDLEQRLTQ